MAKEWSLDTSHGLNGGADPEGGSVQEEEITSIFRGIRRNSELSLQRFAEIHEMDGMPGVMVIRNGDPVEIEVYSNVDFVIQQGVSYLQAPRRR